MRKGLAGGARLRGRSMPAQASKGMSARSSTMSQLRLGSKSAGALLAGLMPLFASECVALWRGGEAVGNAETLWRPGRRRWQLRAHHGTHTCAGATECVARRCGSVLMLRRAKAGAWRLPAECVLRPTWSWLHAIQYAARAFPLAEGGRAAKRIAARRLCACKGVRGLLPALQHSPRSVSVQARAWVSIDDALSIASRTWTTRDSPQWNAWQPCAQPPCLHNALGARRVARLSDSGYRLAICGSSRTGCTHVAIARRTLLQHNRVDGSAAAPPTVLRSALLDC